MWLWSVLQRAPSSASTCVINVILPILLLEHLLCSCFGFRMCCKHADQACRQANCTWLWLCRGKYMCEACEKLHVLMSIGCHARSSINENSPYGLWRKCVAGWSKLKVGLQRCEYLQGHLINTGFFLKLQARHAAASRKTRCRGEHVVKMQQQLASGHCSMQNPHICCHVVPSTAATRSIVDDSVAHTQLTRDSSSVF